LVAFVASALITSAEALGGGLGEQFLPRTITALLRTMFAMLPYMAIAFAAAVVTRSGGAGIGIGLAMLIVEGPITAALAAIGGPFEWIPRLLISSNTDAVMSANRVGTDSTFSQASSNALDPWPAAGVLLIYIAAALGFAFWRFRGRDITSG
jgi:ABC-type transport system involved in multi-copper enzyme maturation permease subunit